MHTIKRLLQCLVCVALLSSATAWAQELRNETLGGMTAGWARAWVDVDGDGRDDFCMLVNDQEKDLLCYMSKPSGVVAQTFSNLWVGYGVPENHVLRWADLNGDGFVDICRILIFPTRVGCRFGPTFTSGFELPLTTASRYQQCVNTAGQIFCGPLTVTPGIAKADFPAGNFPTAVVTPDIHFADVDGDGIPDLCYPYRTAESPVAPATGVDIRCRIAVVGANRTTVTYQPETSAWTRSNVQLGINEYPEGFHDFNGDGRADFCRISPGGYLRCTLSSATGIAQTPEVITASGVDSPHKDGAAFVDINGDGKIDYCRLTGAGNQSWIRCTLSNGVGWEYGTGANANSRELVSPQFSEPGNQYSRWWVDINGDGLPDFCRLAGVPDPIGSGTSDVTGHLVCRLSRGDGVDASSKVAFGYSDVAIHNLNLGRADGGRAFCDVQGTGIQTFCRATYRIEDVGPPECYPHWDHGAPVCSQPQAYYHGYYAGYPNGVVQARQSLLTAYSDGVGAETRITYLPLSNAEVYSRSNTTSNTDARVLLLQPRAPVVYETRAWTNDATPTTLTGNARYLYKDLRTDIWSGSRGFRERWIYNEGANLVDHVVYYQALGPSVDTGSVKDDLREVGMAKCQEKYAVAGGLITIPGNVPNAPVLSERVRALSALRERIPASTGGAPCSLPDQGPTTNNPFVLLQASSNTIGLTTPNNPRVKFVSSSLSQSWDWTGTTRVALPISSNTTTMDDVGNVLSLAQTTTDSANREWRKTTTNQYTDNRALWLLGRLTNATVTTLTPSATVQLAANGSSVGSAPNAALMAPATPVPTPISPAVLAAILQLLLDD